MSIKVITRVLDYSEQRGAARLLLVVLADFANDDGVCWPGTAKLALKINESERYTRLLIQKLMDSGELLRVVGGGRGKPTLYGIAIGLDSAGRKTLDKALERSSRINTVPEYRVSEDRSAPRAKRPRSKNPVPGITDPYNPDLLSQRSVIFSDDTEGQNSAPASQETALPSDSNRHDHDPLVGVGDSRAREKLIAELVRREISLPSAKTIAAKDIDAATILQFVDDMLAAGKQPGTIVNRLLVAPPKPGERYERQRPTPGSSADHGRDGAGRSDRAGDRQRPRASAPRPGSQAYYDQFRSARGADSPADGERTADD